jgi:hypothetical protein
MDASGLKKEADLLSASFLKLIWELLYNTFCKCVSPFYKMSLLKKEYSRFLDCFNLEYSMARVNLFLFWKNKI